MRKYIWIILGALAFLVNWIFGIFPEVYEVVYFRFIFQIIRVVYDYTLGWMPFPMVYVLFFVVVHFIYRFIAAVGRDWKLPWRQRIFSYLTILLSFLGAVVFWFYFLWGFHYQQESLTTRLDLPVMETDTLALYEESLFFTNKLTRLRDEISKDTLPLSFADLPDGYEDEIRAQLTGVLSRWDLPVHGRVRVRSLYPKGILLRISTAGVYIPLVFEGHIDAGLHPIQYPFTMAHEMSHGYGLADEGTCNFTGFAACMASDDPFIQYSASMSLWRYLANNLRRNSPNLYIKLMKELSRNVRTDLIAVMDEMDKYPDIIPEVRDAVYDSYLKSHGVAGGLSNYSKVVEMTLAWKAQNKDVDLLDKIYERD